MGTRTQFCSRVHVPVALPSATASTWSQVSPASHTVGCASLSYMLNFPEIGSILIEKRKKSAMPIGIHRSLNHQEFAKP